MQINIEKIQSEKPIKELLEFNIINVDKPAGCTSFDVADKIKRIFGARKTGHFGTLDPKVTGVLPVAINRACKLTTFFMKKNKTYVGKMHLHKEVEEKKLKEEMRKLTGEIMQKPPVKSRVKRILRSRKVYQFEITNMNKRVVDFIAEVEAGTYIRKLISDLGENIGGAHMGELRRTKAGIFEDKKIHKIEEIKKAFEVWKEKGGEEKLRKILIPAEIIKEIMPVVFIKENNIKQIFTGKPIQKKDLTSDSLININDAAKNAGELFAVFLKDKFVEVAKKTSEGNIILRPEFVLQPIKQ